MKNLYDEIVKILNLKNKTLDDVETIVLIDDIDTKKSCSIPKKDFIRMAREINYEDGVTTGLKLNSGLMLLGRDFRIERRESEHSEFFESSGYFEFISYKVEIPKKINRNPKLLWI